MNRNQMKAKLFILVAVLISAPVFAVLIVYSFPGWDWLKETSPDIIIARCSKAPLQYDTDFEPNSNIDVEWVLKGTNGLRSSILRSFYLPRQGEHYLIFSTYHNGSYQAIEEYRIVPLGVRFSTNAIAGKPLDEQLQVLFKQALDNLNREIQKDQEEKQRLETALKK